MKIQNQNFDSIFSGMGFSEEFTEKLKVVFEDAVTAKAATIKEVSIAGPELAKEEEEPLPLVDPKALAMDNDMKKILAVLKINPSIFARSLATAIKDIEGNSMAEGSFVALMEILNAIAEDQNIASRIAQYLRNKANDVPEAPPEEVPVTEVCGSTTDEDEESEIEIHESMIKRVSDYLSYVAESFVEENKIAIDLGIKNEITESFISGLKNLFSEHNINVPESHDVVDVLTSKVSSLEEEIKNTTTQLEQKLNEEIEKNILIKKQLETENTSKIAVTIAESFKENFTAIQREKFDILVEGIVFEDETSYTEKLSNIVDTIFSTPKTVKRRLKEESLHSDDGETTTDELSPIMSVYSNAISKNLKF